MSWLRSSRQPSYYSDLDRNAVAQYQTTEPLKYLQEEGRLVWHNPNPHQMAETLRMIMMTQASVQPVPVQYNSCILYVLDSYDDMRRTLIAKNQEIEQLQIELEHLKKLKKLEQEDQQSQQSQQSDQVMTADFAERRDADASMVVKTLELIDKERDNHPDLVYRHRSQQHMPLLSRISAGSSSNRSKNPSSRLEDNEPGVNGEEELHRNVQELPDQRRHIPTDGGAAKGHFPFSPLTSAGWSATSHTTEGQRFSPETTDHHPNYATQHSQTRWEVSHREAEGPERRFSFTFGDDSINEMRVTGLLIGSRAHGAFCGSQIADFSPAVRCKASSYDVVSQFEEKDDTRIEESMMYTKIRRVV